MQDARSAIVIRSRYALLVVTFGLAGLDVATGLLGGTTALFAAAAIIAVANVVADLLRRHSRAASWHFWALVAVDTIGIGVGVAGLGALGWIGMPFILITSTAYALGMPRAARVQLLLGAGAYPLARAAGLYHAAGAVPFGLVLFEGICLVGLGWWAIDGPTRITYRIRRVRRALGALEAGDFSVRLPARALDEVGFLSVSFNATAEALGTAVRTLESEIAERGRVESALRQAEAAATRMAERMEAVAAAAAGVLAAGSGAGLHAVLSEACRTVIPHDAFTLAVADPATGALRAPDGVIAPPADVAADERSWATAVRERRSVITCALGDDGPAAATCGIHAPIVAGSQVLGVISVRADAMGAYGADDVQVLDALAALAATALRNIALVGELRRSQEALSHQAYHDPLTGLPNRALLRERAERALAAGVAAGAPERVAMLLLDLDGFKTVNDSLGHSAGDQLLVAVAGRLLNATRGCDTVTRLGGDEFAVLLEHVRDDAEVVVVAERIIRALARPFAVADTLATVGASVGIARGRTPEADPLAGQGHPVSAVGVLLRDADLAMYRAKASGKGTYTLFEPSMHEAAIRRLALETDLRRAVERGEFRVHYQPIVALDSGRITGLEALVRWAHPRRGLVGPADFVEAAEETGLIIEIGRWVLGEACAQAARWQAAQRAGNPHAPPITISVNVSGLQLQDERLVDDVARALADSGLAPGTLVLELTERSIVHDPDTARDRLAALKDVGAQLAIDDFGTGYSALSYLQRFPVDVLKIDKSFVDRIAAGGSHGALARSIIALGDALALRTVAEGVEDAEQRACLRAMGCEMAQGYLFARPVPADDITALLAAGLPALAARMPEAAVAEPVLSG
jgi:diguanylate cyclase (GGDEF)-like protein